MASEPWIEFSPAVGTTAEQQRFLRSADGLSEASCAQSLAGTGATLDEIRRDLTGRRASISAAVRAAGLVLADHVAQGWTVRLHQGRVEIAKPSASPDLPTERQRVRRQLHVERDRQLQTSAVRVFVERMVRRSFHR